MADWVKFADADSNRDLYFLKSAVGAVAPLTGGPARTEVVVSGTRFRLRADTQAVLKAIMGVGLRVPLSFDEAAESVDDQGT
jgi:hypothetical protein